MLLDVDAVEEGRVLERWLGCGTWGLWITHHSFDEVAGAEHDDVWSASQTVEGCQQCIDGLMFL